MVQFIPDIADRLDAVHPGQELGRLVRSPGEVFSNFLWANLVHRVALLVTFVVVFQIVSGQWTKRK